MTVTRIFFACLVLIFGLNACGGNPHSSRPLEDFDPFEFSQPGWRPTSSATTPSIITPSLTAPPSSTPTVPPTPTRTSTPAPTRRPTSTLTMTATPGNPPCLKEGGHYEYHSLSTDLLRAPLEFRVYLPPCYKEQIDQRYPVLYLFHGQSFKDDQWDRIGADETADRLIASGDIPPLIIVMPYDRLGGQPIETKFPEAIVKLLIPHIDQTYRTWPDRTHRAVGGLSRGGGWAIHFGLVYWSVFGLMGAHSPAVFFSDAEHMRVFLDDIPPESTPKIYIDIGDRDRPEIMRAALWFEELLDAKDVPHEWHLFSGYHNEAYWTEHMEGYLRWYTQNW